MLVIAESMFPHGIESQSPWLVLGVFSISSKYGWVVKVAQSAGNARDTDIVHVDRCPIKTLLRSLRYLGEAGMVLDLLPPTTSVDETFMIQQRTSPPLS